MRLFGFQYLLQRSVDILDAIGIGQSGIIRKGLKNMLPYNNLPLVLRGLQVQITGCQNIQIGDKTKYILGAVSSALNVNISGG
jgi:hypothetical protein